MKFIKTLLIASSLFIGYNTKAQEVPKELKDAVITVTTTKGKVYTFSANEYMVVKRKSKAQVAKAKSEEKQEVRRNRITLHGGVGLKGIESSKSNNVVTIEERTRPVFGLSLSRLVTERLSITGTALSNQTFTLGVGLDY